MTEKRMNRYLQADHRVVCSFIRRLKKHIILCLLQIKVELQNYKKIEIKLFRILNSEKFKTESP